MHNQEPKDTKPEVKATAQPAQRRPNDTGSVVVQAHMKIFDPVTKQVFVEGRA